MQHTLTHLKLMSIQEKKGIWALIIYSLSITFTNTLFAQCQLTCNTGVQASLDENCINVITWDALLEGSPTGSCISDLKVEVYTPTGMLLPTSPIVTNNEIDFTLTGKVIHVPSGQSCQTNILVEDKLPPRLFCVDTLISCFHDTMPAKLGIPVHYDNCSSIVEISNFDINTTFNCNESDTILIVNRKWTARDSSGNASVCWQNIFVERPSLDSIDFPISLDNISAPPLDCNSAITDIEFTGIPLYDSLQIDSICGFYTTYEDVIVPICGASYTIFRTWNIYDGCDDTLRTKEQTINVMDTLPPDLICPQNFVVALPNNVCEVDVTIPTPATSDSCSNDITIMLEGSFGLIAGTSISSLTMGVHNTKCIAADACGNKSTCQFKIHVEDHAPPVAVGISSPIVSLLPQGTTYLPAATFDGGSWDNCDEVILAARRLDMDNCQGNNATDFGLEVPFYCCDAGQNVEIELRVMDASGNQSIVSTIVQVNDNIDPELICPADITVDCSDDYLDLNVTAEPDFEENCSGFQITFADSISLNICGSGLVERHWRIKDIADQEDACVQKISISNLTPFYINTIDPNDPNDGVKWPKNYISTTCGEGLLPADLPDEFAEPTVFSDDFCQMIAVNYNDTWLSNPNNACIEILRSWTIVDWCQFNPATFEGSWHYGQVLRIQNSDDPIIDSSCQFEEFCSNDNDCLTGEINLSIDASDDCNEPSELIFLYEIDFNDDGSINTNGEGSTINIDVPIGVHRVYWKVADGCSNTAECNYIFSVVDCKKPTPVCEQKIIEIADDVVPSVKIIAAELNAGTFDNCTSENDLQFSFSPDPLNNNMIFDCSHIGINSVEIWATDDEGNQDFCITEIIVQDNNNLCSTASFVSGEIITNGGGQVANVSVSLNSSTVIDSMVTGLDGLYSFNNVQTGNDYTISPYKNNNPINGVTTFDLVLISRHILGITALDSPYKIIAADANKSKTVTTFDLVQLRKLILNIDLEFTNNKSWRFVNKNYQFINPLNPLDETFPEVTNINNLSADFMADFIAVKIGDVNGSADATE